MRAASGMAENTIRSLLRLNQKTYEELYTENKIFREGESVVCVIPAAQDAVQQEPCVMLKIGDGVTPFRSLPWVSGLAANVYDWALSSSKPDYQTSEIKGLDTKLNDLQSSIQKLKWKRI